MSEGLKQYVDNPDFGLLMLRLGAGVTMIGHGVLTFMGGTHAFDKLGHAMSLLGVDSGFVFWGFMAALVQVVGGLCINVGFLFRMMCFLLLATMGMAIAYHVDRGDALLGDGGHAITLTVIFAALLFIGPGKYAIDGN